MRTKYVADDGTEFADRDACERYEAQVDFIRIMVDTIKPQVAEYFRQKLSEGGEGVDGTKFVIIETFNYMMDHREAIRGFLND
ncbi:MAG: hypothetical protein JSR83_01805 [Proteobacteria bacterium]|nr:hypothetical protein [Pseudomonadota bacterium]